MYKVDVDFFYGRLHRIGGVKFLLISLSILVGCLAVLRKLEGHGRPRSAGEDQAGFTAQPASLP